MELLQGHPAARLQLAAALVVVAVEGLIVGERLLRMTCLKDHHPFDRVSIFRVHRP